MVKNIVVLFGGVSAEHEVSIISGIQVLENINREKYNPLAIYQDKTGKFWYIPSFKNKKDFRKTKYPVNFVVEGHSTYITYANIFTKKYLIDGAFLAFHGGSGEGGDIQGFLNTLNIPYTSPSIETSVLAMNKVWSKRVISELKEINMIEDVALSKDKYLEDKVKCVDLIEEKLGYPVIIKPAHLGSSIGISVAKERIELEKGLHISFEMDNEVLVEKCISEFYELNLSVMRDIDGNIITSSIEKPFKKGEVLSFADKYENGTKSKTGAKEAGMAMLDRELPANISKELEEIVRTSATKIYQTLLTDGLVRIDFMIKDDIVYFEEINTIPGSLSFFLWEPNGIQFSDLIENLIERSFIVHKGKQSRKLEYSTDIVEKYLDA